MTLRRKIRWLTWIGLIGCLMAAVPALYLLRHGLMEERGRLAANLADSAREVLTDLQAKVETGALTPGAARALAQETLRAFGGEPFHITVFTGRIPNLEELAAGHLIVSSVTFEPWGWTIVAAGSTHDLDQDFRVAAFAFALFIGVLMALSWPLARYLSANVVGPIEALSARMARLTEGQTDIDIPGRDRRDEFGAMARSMEYFRRAAEALIQRDERVFGIMNGIGEPILLVDADGMVEEHNRAAVALFGLPEAGLRAVRFPDLFAESDRDTVEALLEGQRGGTGGPERVEGLAVERAAGRVEVSLTLSSLAIAGRRSTVCMLADMTERLRHERELLRLATRDRLTGLPNLALIESTLETALDRRRRDGRRLAVLCLDLSRFKLITDTLGYSAGDALLVEVAARIMREVGAADRVGRIGTNDFAIVLEEIGEPQEAAAFADRVIASFDAPVRLADSEHYVRPSAGIALFPDHAGTVPELIRAADAALYAAKRQGGRRHAFFRKEMTEQARRHLALDRDLRAALAEGQFRLHYQPKVSLLDGTLQGFEALLRWERPGLGMVSPGEFIPVAEETGFIVPLGDWVLAEACRQQRAWALEGLDPVPVAVNISPRHLRHRSAEDFRRIIADHSLPPHLIELEITEGAVIQDIEHAMAVLGALQAMGIRVAVDDFGTGHSSLGYLKSLPVTTLKIDRSFVSGVPNGRKDAAIVTTILTMAEMLGLEVVAEGVETLEQADFLRGLNCTLAQGWLTGRPGEAARAAELLVQRERLQSRAGERFLESVGVPG
ncbi:EAL domain-containing protein [Azospirillum sp. SYSU D00513]|uniref:putative bifunctional diguanylate cyclase/phosphodiesterase n=1 Tax=Azospirillum sp. SYSU D00513 TaxID=2812561 RepID=UPI001A9745BA|nr:EAL domain-containing protein [Azospirillum sp. SYSU D00513]